ncbi:MAG: hypothetical protein OXN85_00920, partial [Gemmatimonadetes bacterium]|nr:hypothetical protein [Candidatus Palauibacter australiensis]
GLMPHPERHSLSVLGNTDGLGVFQSLLAAVARGRGRRSDPAPPEAPEFAAGAVAGAGAGVSS